MNRKILVMKNSTMGLLSQGLTVFFTFLTRSLFVQHIGLELLSINSTFASVLDAISLAELGFHSAIIFSLYKPLHDQDESAISDIMNILKVVYRGIGLLFLVAAILVLPFLKYILKGVLLSPVVYIYFLLQAGASTCSYFFAYKRALLLADQKEYIAKSFDLVVNVLFNMLQCILLWIFKNYFVYLGLKWLQVLISNLVVHSYCTKRYAYLRNAAFNTEKFRGIWSNVKDIFAGKIAGYIYGSTDNLVVSTFVSTLSVGYLVNYTTITKSMTVVCLSILQPIAPIIGSYLVENKGSTKREKLFLLYTHARYLLTLAIVVPIMVLIDDFIVLWLGKNMVMPGMITVLLAVDFYISLVHSATLDFINGEGLFRKSRTVEIMGAIINIVTSVFLVHLMGVAGVLLGTVISQLYFWAGRTHIVYKYCIKSTRKEFIRYWLKNVLYGIGFVADFFLCEMIYRHLEISNAVVKFVAGGLVCEIVLLFFSLVLLSFFQEQKMLNQYVISILRNKMAND